MSLCVCTVVSFVYCYPCFVSILQDMIVVGYHTVSFDGIILAHCDTHTPDLTMGIVWVSTADSTRNDAYLQVNLWRDELRIIERLIQYISVWRVVQYRTSDKQVIKADV